MWAVPGQEIASSASPFNALILSHCTSKITAGSRQRQGVSHHRREDMIDLTLRDIVISHPTICPCHSLPPWGLVQCLHSKLETALWYRQLIRDSKVWTCKQCLIILPGRNSKALWLQRTNPFHQAPGADAAAWLTSWLYWPESWTSFDKLQFLKSKALPDKFWGPEQSKEESISCLC